MGELAIKVEGLSKEYRIGAAQRGYKTLREAIGDAALAPLRRLRAVMRGRASESATESFMALSDVSFEVERGDIVGVVGRNGAGKSTLLKILSRITTPTSGTADIHGRVGSLLEVGTGFHPELTGRENIYLNGAILGMTKREIDRKFDDIVAFSEIAQFIDTPVKRYSSGMYVRLAFAVAAHLEPEILLVDEVLAVGDASFQRKCIGKMKEVAEGGRTVFFVSHNLGAVKQLCTKAILLEKGRLRSIGPVDEILSVYLAGGGAEPERVIRDDQHWQGTLEARIVRSTIGGRDGSLRNEFLIGEPIVLTAEYEVKPESIEGMSFWVLVFAADGTPVLNAMQRDQGSFSAKHGLHRMRVTLDPIGLLPGTYTVAMGIFGHDGRFLDWVNGCQSLTVTRTFVDGRDYDSRWGYAIQSARWENE